LKVESHSSIASRLRLGLTVIIALMMVSWTATLMLFNGTQVLAYSRVIDNGNGHSTIQMPEKHSPSVSSPATTPTIQAPLQIPRTLQSTDLVNSLAFYEVTFITSTTGAIDKIRMDFPAGTSIAAAGLIERIGIGGGTLLKSGSSITYDLTAPVSIPAGTFIRLEIFGIKNPTNPSTTFTATITTRDSAGNLIDGPSQTNVYTMKQIASDDVAESFMKRVTLLDDAAGNSKGWNPGNGFTSFTISEPAVTSSDGSFISISIIAPGQINNEFCEVDSIFPFSAFEFTFHCQVAPVGGSQLHYVVENLPPHVGG
jgi:hypothetical protein